MDSLSIHKHPSYHDDAQSSDSDGAEDWIADNKTSDLSGIGISYSMCELARTVIARGVLAVGKPMFVWVLYQSPRQD